MADNRDGGRRQDVLAVLRERPAPMSITAIAERLDVHPNTVRFHLETLTLVASGQAELDPTMSVRDLQPFAEPDLCLTHLERNAAVPKAGP